MEVPEGGLWDLVSAPVPATVARAPARVRATATAANPSLVALRRYRLAAVPSLNLVTTILANLSTTMSAAPRSLLRTVDCAICTIVIQSAERGAAGVLGAVFGAGRYLPRSLMKRRTRLRRLVVGARGAAAVAVAVAVAGGAGVPAAARECAWTPTTRSRNLSLRSPSGPRSPRSPSRRRTLGAVEPQSCRAVSRRRT